jgi:hypothetical protein
MGLSLYWADEMIEALADLRSRGETLMVCAEEIGVSYGPTVRKARELHLARRMNRGRRRGTDVVAAARRPLAAAGQRTE